MQDQRSDLCEVGYGVVGCLKVIMKEDKISKLVLVHCYGCLTHNTTSVTPSDHGLFHMSLIVLPPEECVSESSEDIWD